MPPPLFPYAAVRFPTVPPSSAYRGRARSAFPLRPCSAAPAGSGPSRPGRGDSGGAECDSGPGPKDPWLAPPGNTWNTRTATPSFAPWWRPEEAERAGQDPRLVPPPPCCDWLVFTALWLAWVGWSGRAWQQMILIYEHKWLYCLGSF